MANADFRGFVQTTAPQYLGYVGNDGGVNTAKLKADIASGVYSGQGSGIASRSASGQELAYNSAVKAIQGLVGTYQTAPAAATSSGKADAPADLSSYDQGIDATNAQINGLDPQLANAIGTAENNYTTTINKLANDKSIADRNYGTAKTTDAQDFVGSKNTINTNTGNTISTINRVLGSRGAGGQSAGKFAGLVAAGAGSQQRAGAATTFGKNEQSLDTNYGDFNAAYKTNVDSAGAQKENDANAARASSFTTKASLLQQLATLINQRTAASGGSGTDASQPLVEQAKSLLAQATQLGTPKPVAAQTPLAYTPPSLSSYTTNPTAVTPAGARTSAATDTVVPYLSLLANRDKQLQTA